MKTRWIHASLVALPLLSGCNGAPDTAEEERLGEASQAFTIDASMVTVTESPADRNTWPKNVTWCVAAGHEAHGPFYWKVSWSSSLQPTTTNCITYATSAEICGLHAMIDHDSSGHTGDVAHPKYHSVLDHRDPITPNIVPSPTAEPLINQAVALTAPEPHCTRHCDGAGATVWQVQSQQGVWYDLAGSQNACTWTVTSSTTGKETYRLKSTHQGLDSYSNDIVVTWINTCHAEVTCPNGSTKHCDGAPGTCSTTTYSALCDDQGYMCACTVGCSTNSQCDQYCGGAGTGSCSSVGCNPYKPNVKYCNCFF